jgi:hypothetical protein
VDGEKDEALLVGHIHPPLFIYPDLMRVLVQQHADAPRGLDASRLEPS